MKNTLVEYNIFTHVHINDNGFLFFLPAGLTACDFSTAQILRLTRHAVLTDCRSLNRGAHILRAPR